MIKTENVLIKSKFNNKIEAMQFLGEFMVKQNIISKEYINSMIKRDEKASVAIGNYLAIAHGEYQASDYIINPSVVIIKLENELNWDNQKIKVIIGLALKGDKQMEWLQKLAIKFSDILEVENFLAKCNTPKQITNYFNNIDETL